MIPAFLLGPAVKLVGERYAKPLIYAGAAILLVGAALGAKAIYDRNVIEDHDARQAVHQVNEDRKADQAVAAQRRKDDIRINQEASALERIAENETTDMARRLARHRCIRMQQAARRDGREPPAC